MWDAHVRTKRTRQGSWGWLCWCPTTRVRCCSYCSRLPAPRSRFAGAHPTTAWPTQICKSNPPPQQCRCASSSSIGRLCRLTEGMGFSVSRYPHLIYLKPITSSTYATASRFKKRWPSWPPATSTRPLSLLALVKVLSVKHLQTFSLCNLRVAGSKSLYTKLSPPSWVGGFFQLICNLSGTSALGSFSLVSTARSAALSRYTLSSIELMGRREQSQKQLWQAGCFYRHNS